MAVHLGAPVDDGFRPWVAERGPGGIDRIEVFGGGDVVATITGIGGGDDLGYSIDTC